MKVGGVQRKEKKTKRFVTWKTYFASCSFSLLFFFCTSKAIT